MKVEFTAIVKQDGDWWLGSVEEIPGANAQEKNKTIHGSKNSLRSWYLRTIEMANE